MEGWNLPSLSQTASEATAEFDALAWCKRRAGPIVAALYDEKANTTPELGIDIKAGADSLRIPLVYYCSKPSTDTVRLYTALMEEFVQELSRQGVSIRCPGMETAAPSRISTRRAALKFDDAPAPAPEAAPATVSAGPLLLIIDDDRGLQPKIEKYLSYLGWRLKTVPGGVEGMESIRSMQPAALAIAHDMRGMTGLDLLEIVRSQFSSQLAACCYCGRITGAMSKRGAALGSALLPEDGNLGGALIAWLQDTVPIPQQPEPAQSAAASAALALAAAAAPVDREELFEDLWKRLSGKRVDELRGILGVDIALTPAGGGWMRFAYASVSIKILVKNQKISILGVE